MTPLNSAESTSKIVGPSRDNTHGDNTHGVDQKKLKAELLAEGANKEKSSASGQSTATKEANTSVFKLASALNSGTKQSDLLTHETNVHSKIIKKGYNADFGRAVGYASDTGHFAAKSRESVESLTQSFRQGDIKDFKGLLTSLSQLRQSVQGADAKDLGFGVLRDQTGDMYVTPLNVERFSLDSKKLQNEYSRRDAASDSQIRIYDAQEMAKSDSSIDYTLLKYGGNYTLYKPVFTNNDNKDLTLTKLFIAEGMGLCRPKPIEYKDPDTGNLVRYQDKLITNVFDYLQPDQYRQHDINEIGDFMKRFDLVTKLEPQITLHHPVKADFQQLMKEMDSQFESFKANIDAGNTEDAFRQASDLVYLFANTCPYDRGSAWSSEVLASSLMQYFFNDMKDDFLQTDLDFMAFGLSSEEFHQEIKNFVLEHTEKLPSEAMKLLNTGT